MVVDLERPSQLEVSDGMRRGGGVIGGAGLDVFEDEPDVPAELLAMDNVVLSPHRAVLTPESMRGLLDVVAGNLDAFFAGRPLLSPVSL